MAALSEMGVPLVSLPGEGYELMEGFYLSPLIFTPAEASALFLGAQMLLQQAAGSLSSSAEQALAKITAILPQTTHEQVQRLTEIIRFILPRDRFNLDDSRLILLQQAILEQRVLHIRYHSYSRDETTERDIEPYQLFYSNGVWYVTGYCRLRQDQRDFRLDRVDALKLLTDTFTPRSSSPSTSQPIEIRVYFAAPTIRWVRERQHYAFVADIEESPSGVVMRYRVDTFSEITPWLLSWGAAAEVLAPAELREQIRQEAFKLATMLA